MTPERETAIRQAWHRIRGNALKMFDAGHPRVDTYLIRYQPQIAPLGDLPQIEAATDRISFGRVGPAGRQVWCEGIVVEPMS